MGLGKHAPKPTILVACVDVVPNWAIDVGTDRVYGAKNVLLTTRVVERVQRGLE
jgi:hypothetical protein